ncbi:hypothetical protein F511_33865 [Dorcoceras hygrometricum]|uniref:Uncharacterized protein n=1 Tax=Dorcoceras hygrometricum TaxID=472368 RepID=A0A2Z7AFG0_9LAMI|nr:hypothetical protein F511_33865 [Dorcoceras hygrometricum]
MQRCRDQTQVIALYLPDPATIAGALPSGPPPGPGGSNVTNLASNRGLTRENSRCKWTHQPCCTVATTFWYQQSFSLLRPPLPKPFWLDHPQVQTVPTRPTLAPTEHTRRRTNHTKRARGVLLLADVRPLNLHLEPRKATPRTTMNHLTLSQIPSSSPSTEAMQNKSNREVHMKRNV